MRHCSHAPSSHSEEFKVSAAAGIWRRLDASVKMRRLTAALAVVSMLASQAQATTFYYYRGGAQSGTPTGTPPASPAAQGTFAILVDTPSPNVAVIGDTYSATTYAYSNTGPVVFSVLSGTLPSGVTINPTTGTISGSAKTAGTSTAVIQGIDTANGNASTTALTIDAFSPFSISGNPGTVIQVNTPYSAAFTLAGGGQPYGFSVGAMPPGMTLAAGATSASVTGTPTVPGHYNITVTGSEVHGLTASFPFTLDVITPLTVAGAPPASGTVGVAYSGQFTVSGGEPPYVYSTAAGTYPTGVTLKSATGVISGTPSVAGLKSGIKVKVTDSVGSSVTSNAVSITIAASGAQTLTISGSGTATGKVGVAYSASFSAGGGTGGYVYAIASGVLPAGVTLSPATGTISGTPAVGSDGNYPNISVKVTDSGSHTAVSNPFSVLISPAPVPLSITGSPALTVQRGDTYAAKFTGTGGTGYHFANVGTTLPPGLTFDTTAGLISGSPTTAGAYAGLRIQVIDSGGGTAASAAFTITVSVPPPLTVSGSAAPTVALGDSFSATFTGFDSSGFGYHFTSVGGPLPPGLSLSDINGVQGLISGTTTIAGAYSGIEIQVIDLSSSTAVTSLFTITVLPPPPPPQDTLTLLGVPQDAVYGQAYSDQFAAGGGAPPYVYAITGTLPPGLTFDTTSGTISGTPTTIASYPGLQVTATDSASDTASTGSFSITVTDPNPLTISWTPQTNWQVGDFVAIAPNTFGGDSNNYAFSSNGTLPPGLSLFSNGSLWAIACQAMSFGRPSSRRVCGRRGRPVRALPPSSPSGGDLARGSGLHHRSP